MALRALAICRTDGAIGLLGKVAQHWDIDEVCIEAARELLQIPLFPAQKIVNQILSSPPAACLRNREFMDEFRSLAECCYFPSN